MREGKKGREDGEAGERQRSCGRGRAGGRGRVGQKREGGYWGWGTHSQSKSGNLEIFRWGKKDVSGCTLIKKALMIG